MTRKTDTPPRTCSRCRGSGSIPRPESVHRPHFVEDYYSTPDLPLITCDKCGGQGVIVEDE